MSKEKKENHYKSVFDKETDLLKALIKIHLDGKDIECDPMYFKGNFYKDGISKPKFKFDLNPQTSDCEQFDACNLSLKVGLGKLNNLILDPPFLFGIHGKTKDYYSSKTHTIYPNFQALESDYRALLSSAYNCLRPKGKLIFKCQDYTDSKTTLTHCLVYNWATERGFYAKDIAILVKPNKVFNPNTTQRHLRKIHTYFYVFEK